MDFFGDLVSLDAADILSSTCASTPVSSAVHLHSGGSPYSSTKTKDRNQHISETRASGPSGPSLVVSPSESSPWSVVSPSAPSLGRSSRSCTTTPASTTSTNYNHLFNNNSPSCGTVFRDFMQPADALPEELRYYELCWTRVVLDHSGRLGGKPAFDFLSLSRLPKEALKRRTRWIWEWEWRQQSPAVVVVVLLVPEDSGDCG